MSFHSNTLSAPSSLPVLQGFYVSDVSLVVIIKMELQSSLLPPTMKNVENVCQDILYMQIVPLNKAVPD